ncbi:hypothetical protein N7490_000304 [Penicillium lividum]|nr:hypothetical protein N7490_000304 [Penicillium lividum]
MSCRPDGSDFQELVTGLQTLPDGIAIDTQNQKLYWTNMGESMVNDGSIQRCDLSGANIVTIIPNGIYWCDREGMRVMRADLDGSNVEVLYHTGSSDDDREDRRNWCVGIAVDDVRGKLYWSQKGPSKGGQGKIMCMHLEPHGEANTTTSVREVYTILDNLPEPIDLELDPNTNTLYWTDRGDLPFGNSVNAVHVDAAHKVGMMALRILVQRLHEGIGLSLDLKHGRMFLGDLMGGVYTSRLDGTQKKTLFTDLGDITGIEYAAY